MQKLTIKTNKNKEVIDITTIINDLLMKNAYHNGSCYLFLTHTTCAISLANLEQDSKDDYMNAFMELIPKINYKHPFEPTPFGDHLIPSILGQGIYIPVQNASMVLGAFQRLVLFEFAGPRDRTLLVNYIKENF